MHAGHDPNETPDGQLFPLEPPFYRQLAFRHAMTKRRAKKM
jgi:hypothetical protein